MVSLEQHIIHNPVTVSPSTPLQAVLEVIHETETYCRWMQPEESATFSVPWATPWVSDPMGFALVVEGSTLVGMCVDKDLLRHLTASDADLALRASDVMIRQPVTLKRSQLTHPLEVLTVFKQHHLDYCAVLEDNDQLVGVLTLGSLYRYLQPFALFRLQTLADVDLTQVPQFPHTTTAWDLMQSMIQAQIDTVLITSESELDLEPTKHLPTGIVTGHDLAQLYRLQLNFSEIEAHQFMNQPLLSLSVTHSLWDAYQLMHQHHMHHVGVTNISGNWLGLFHPYQSLKMLDSNLAFSTVAAFNQYIDQVESSHLTSSSDQTRLISSIINHYPAAIFWKDSNLIYQGGNTQFAKIAGLSSTDAIVGKDDFAMNWAMGDAELLRARDRQVMTTGQPIQNLVEPNRRPDGQQSWLETNTFPLFDDQGRAIGVLGVLKDVTQQYEAQENLRRSEQRYRTIFERAAVGIVENSLEGYCLVANEKFLSLVGYSLEELRTKTDLDITHPADIELSRNQVARLSQGTITSFVIEKRYIRKDTSVVWVELTVSLLRDVNQQPERLISIAQDISDRKHSEETIQQVLAQERELAELKSRFISMMSHEFRTPLSVISTSVGILQDYGHRLSADRATKHMQSIQTYIKQITALLDEILLINQAESGNLTFNPATVNLIPLCQGWIQEWQLAHPRNPIQLTLHRQDHALSTPDRCDITLDAKLINLSLSLLVANSANYSAQGQPITLTINIFLDRIVYCIHDQGIGIPPCDIEHVFDMFYRGSNVEDRPGTGLGLSIVNKCIQLHSGSITLKSQLNAGTTVTVEIPLNSLN